MARCEGCALPAHRIVIKREQSMGRWYVSCRNMDCLDRWIKPGPDGRFGRKKWEDALGLGIEHLKAMDTP